MDDAGIGVLVLGGLALFGLILFGAFMFALEQRKKIGDVLHRVAEKVGGELEKGGLFNPDSVIRFRISGRPALLRFSAGGKNRPASTAVEVDLHGRSPGVLKIFPEHFGDSILKFFGSQDIAVGDREFDALYVVKATPEPLAHRVFSPERRADVVACVRRLGGTGSAVVDLGRDRLVVRVAEGLEMESSILNLVGVASEFLEYVLQAGAPGDIRWVDSPEKAGGQCQVCGTEMKDRIVLCARCKTPHHEECWLYVGECSTFACKERRFVMGGRTFTAPRPRQTPDEWLRGEIERDRREMARREAEESLQRFERRQQERRD